MTTSSLKLLKFRCVCPGTIVCTPCKAQCHILPVLHGIAACSATGYRCCRRKRKKEKKKFKSYPIGYFHVDIAEVQTEEGRLYLFTAIDRTSKFACAELQDEATRATAKNFLERLVAAVPYTIHTILTDNGIQFTNRKSDTIALMTPFGRVCSSHGIEHRLTKVKHPWTNGQVERMNRTIKEATVGRYHYGSHKEVREHLHAFLVAYNLANRLKTLKGSSPYDFIRNIWTVEPERFTFDTNHFNGGLNTHGTAKGRPMRQMAC